MTLGKLGDRLVNSDNLQVSMEVTVSEVPRSIGDIPQYFVLKSLYDLGVAFFGTAQKLNSISPYWF